MFALDPQSIRQPILIGCEVPHLEHAVARYPGAETRETTIPPGATVAVALDSCLRQIGLEGDGGARLVTSFLLRLIEHRWRETNLRTGALRIAEIVRPPDSMSAQADAVLASFDALIALLPDVVAGGRIEGTGAALFRVLCRNRKVLLDLRGGLARMAELKRLHDALHVLQVLGDGHLERALKGCDSSTVDLPAEAGAWRDRCTRALTAAAGHLATGDPERAAFARRLLRELFRVELPQMNLLLSEEMSGWPLREMRELLDAASQSVGVEYDRNALFDLHDNLLRRLLAHSLWQDVDLRLYDMEEIFDAQPQEWLDALVPHLTTVRQYLRALGAAPEPRQGLTSELTAAVEAAAGRDDPQTRAGLREGYDELVWRARQNFVEVDGKLKADFEHFMQLAQRLDTMIQRVPAHCELLVDDDG